VSLEPGQYCGLTLYNNLKGKDGASVSAYWNAKSENSVKLFYLNHKNTSVNWMAFEDWNTHRYNISTDDKK
jgi:hypothetical protein